MSIVRQRLKSAGLRALFLVPLLPIPLSGCRQDMQNQPKIRPLRSSGFFADGRGARAQVADTVARSQRVNTSYFSTGLVNGKEGDGLPIPLSYGMLARGQERFNVYCSPCHSRVGNGKGMIVQRGYHPAGNLLSDRLGEAPLGHFFFVMTHGYGAMPDYSAQIAPQDRWAIAGYIRALELSQNANATDVAPGAQVVELKAALERAGRPPGFLNDWNMPAATADLMPTALPMLSISAGAQKTPEAGNAAGAAGAATQAGTAQGEKPVKSPGRGTAEAGQKLYLANCAVCHQPTRLGIPPIFPVLLGVVDRIGEENVRDKVRNGIPDSRPPMPPHPQFTESDMNDLIAFLRTK
jgi:mono/diheme cytochrome c family protein